MATFGWSYKSNASGSKRPKEQSRKLEEWQINRPSASTKALHLQSHSAETLSAGTKPRRKFDPRAKIFVGNLDWKTTEATLADYFSTFGEIEGLKIVKDHETGTSRGFAFITFTEVESAIKCKKWCSYNHLVYGPFGTSTMLQWSKAGFFDAGCWVRQTDPLSNHVGETEAKKARLVDQVYSDSSDSDDDSKSHGDPPGNEFVHVSEIDFAMFP